MKYIDATTQNSLKQGVMELLELSAGEMIQMFMSIYEDTEKEPWEWVRDFLSELGVNETLEYKATGNQEISAVGVSLRKEDADMIEIE